MADVFDKAERSRIMSRIRGKNTKPEMIVRSLAHRMGYRFRLHRSDLPGKPDLVFPGRRKIIFVHGCFWHMHNCRKGRSKPASNVRFWRDKRQANRERDRKNIQKLRRMGWSVMVVWECRTESPDKLAAELDDFLG